MRRPRRPGSVRARIALTVAAAVLASTVTATVVAYRVEEHGLRDQFRSTALQDVGVDAQQATVVAQSHAGAVAAAQAAARSLRRQNVSADLDGFAIYVTDHVSGPAGGDVAGSSRPAACSPPSCDLPVGATTVASLLASLIASAAPSRWSDSPPRLAVARLIERTSGPDLALVEFYNYSAVHRQLARLRNDLLVLDAIGLVAAVLLGVIVSTGISRPVRRTALAARRLGDGDLDARIPVSGSGELARLATDFNTMAQRLSDTLGDLRLSRSLQQRFVADVSHELRSPLAAMIAAGEGLDASDRAVRSRAAALVREQTRRMAIMVDDLLEMSRFDAGQITPDHEPVELAELARDAVRAVAPGVGVRVAALGEVVIDTDPRRVHTVLRNLVANACQHGAAPVDVVVDGRADPVVITVADDGPGVPDRIADTLFERFVRADTARGAATGADHTSTGLGLAIAVENARVLSATLQLEPGTRTAFSLRLPRRLSASVH